MAVDIKNLQYLRDMANCSPELVSYLRLILEQKVTDNFLESTLNSQTEFHELKGWIAGFKEAIGYVQTACMPHTTQKK